MVLAEVGRKGTRRAFGYGLPRAPKSDSTSGFAAIID